MTQQQPLTQQQIEAAIRAQLDKLKHIPPFTVEAIDETTQQPRVWFFGGAGEIEVLRMIDAADRLRVFAMCGAEIGRWERASAATKRVWQYHESMYGQWKAALTVEYTTPPAAVEAEEAPPAEGEKAKKTKAAPEWKAPPEWQVEARYRNHPNYRKMNINVERAEEAHNTVLGIINAWETIARLLGAPTKG